MQKCTQWFANHGRQRHGKDKYSGGRKWNWRQVIAEERADEIKQVMDDLSDGAMPGSKEYFATYQKSLTTVAEGLDDEEMERLKQVAKEWRKLGPPPALQQK